VIDFDALVLGPSMQVFGALVTYEPALSSPVAAGGSFDVTAIFDDGFVSAGEFDQGVITSNPRLGIQLSQFPAGFDPKLAQGDRFTVRKTGRTYVVKLGMPDGQGGARLDANLLRQP